MSLLQLKNVQVRYQRANKPRPGDITAVRDVSFAIEPGECVALVGESGCGKSSLARAITGLQAVSGAILVNGHPLMQLSARQRAAQLQMIFQDSVGAFNPRQRLGQAIAEPLLIQQPQLSAQQRQQKVQDLLAQMELSPELARYYPAQVSGGQCQRAAIARALITQPQLLVCDEPVSALDVTVRTKILQLLRDCQQQRQLALLFITHDLAVARQLCSRVLVMYAGRIVEQGATDALFAQPRHPYTKALLAAVPRLNSAPPPILAGEPPSLAAQADNNACAFAPRCAQVMPRCWQARPVLPAEPTAAACHLETKHD
ncbi:MAG TPA: ABC transporter ATP-binding protein [Gammaproteobacteria bacterium]|nr:ABC transporter ATP-binding protein [Gammaproteobacteria bacterium]